MGAVCLLSPAADLKQGMDHYLGSLKNSKVKSLKELVEWNRDHAEEALTKGRSVWSRPFTAN